MTRLLLKILTISDQAQLFDPKLTALEHQLFHQEDNSVIFDVNHGHGHVSTSALKPFSAKCVVGLWGFLQ